MCGLIFLYKKGEDDKTLLNMAEGSLAEIEHRGPDDKGIWQGQSVVAGHRRLSIIDLAASRQPMLDPLGRFILTYNGEIYNFRELKKSLESRWNFRTSGDTELVLAGLILYGESFLNRMEGMWALALWDNQEKNLLLSRDRIGKKPLFYQYDNNAFSCASELNALTRLSFSPWQEDIDSTADYLRYGYYLPGTTAYKKVYEVLPGHVLKWHPGSEPDQHPFWSLSIGHFSGTKKHACKILRETLIRAVERRLVADVEVGAFLSGGIDSSLIVSILSKELGINSKTFTIGFKEKSYDERKYASQVALLCATDHFEQRFENWDRDKLITLILKYAGQPFSDSSLLPTSMVSELASKKVKVVLSGDGGDELFSGYQRYQARALLRWYSRLPKALQENIKKLVQSFPEPVSHHSRSFFKKAHLFIDIVNRQHDETPYIAPLLYSNEVFQKLAPDLTGKGHAPPGLPPETSEDSLQEMMAADTLIYLPQDIMTKVDRASMAHSLEARAPFLDKEVVELAFSLPRTWHRRGFRGKRMLYDSFHDLLPNEIWYRRKQGFGVPIHQWFRGELGIQLIDLAEQMNTLLNVGFIKDMLHIHQSGKRDHGYRLWNIYIYLMWRHQQIYG
ncbi:Asparagine synthetase [Desulfonema limicola]|uniref:asparagine synthase (glutamine-hydrolyzing) n=1 Tax=Desulfonema limicola TaxID=45656 RepID=A0A975BAU7_9BACT|nr:asparagine synthase (glutamine-hydrolyzing) [Desulfonema limicola]QTA81902.1 Asparagine synthetase [Desulfonema limicola]